MNWQKCKGLFRSWHCPPYMIVPRMECWAVFRSANRLLPVTDNPKNFVMACRTLKQAKEWANADNIEQSAKWEKENPETVKIMKEMGF